MSQGLIGTIAKLYVKYIVFITIIAVRPRSALARWQNSKSLTKAGKLDTAYFGRTIKKPNRLEGIQFQLWSTFIHMFNG